MSMAIRIFSKFGLFEIWGADGTNYGCLVGRLSPRGTRLCRIDRNGADHGQGGIVFKAHFDSPSLYNKAHFDMHVSAYE